MDVGAVSMAMSQINLKTNWGMAMLDKGLEMNEEAGANMIQMMDKSLETTVNPNIGSNFDVSV
ncbi:MAG: YjfB family protein [Lachnospiraceae bacterium]|nr:YjfB family protein [Lachnospiraceae bacterium]